MRTGSSASHLDEREVGLLGERAGQLGHRQPARRTVRAEGRAAGEVAASRRAHRGSMATRTSYMSFSKESQLARLVAMPWMGGRLMRSPPAMGTSKYTSPAHVRA
jgi:hypothetical protein